MILFQVSVPSIVPDSYEIFKFYVNYSSQLAIQRKIIFLLGSIRRNTIKCIPIFLQELWCLILIFSVVGKSGIDQDFDLGG